MTDGQTQHKAKGLPGPAGPWSIMDARRLLGLAINEAYVLMNPLPPPRGYRKSGSLLYIIYIIYRTYIFSILAFHP